MKLRFLPITTIGLFLCSLGLAMPSIALPLQVGVYRVGSTYIQIAQKGNRLCFRGFSARGATTASIYPDSENPGFYKINGLTDLVISQQDPKTLLFGNLNSLSSYEADYEFPRDITDDLQRCLQSKKTFLERVSGGRGGS
ncbi:MAG: hypothetical protein U7123_04470 [Potamolinea sp.]